MAAKQPQIETGESAKREMSLAQNILAFALATLMAGGAGALHGVLIRPSDAPVATNPPGGPSDDRKFAALVEMGTLDLAPVVTNLAAPSDVWVRVEGSLVFEGKTLPHGEALAGQIAGDILAFLRTQTLAQIQGVAGLLHLRQDLNERVATRSQGQVREFIIRTLVVQ
jgi:flagellar FliL protein